MVLPAPPDGSAPGYYGLYPAVVTDIVDRDGLGRVEVRFPWLGETGDRDVRAWATLCTPYADENQGLEVLPEVGSHVVVGFEAGNLRRPYLLAAAWHGHARMPQPASRSNDVRVLRSRAGSRLEFDDNRATPKVKLAMASGHEVVLDNAAQQVTVRHANGCVVTLTPTSVQINANISVDVTAPAVNVNAATSTFSGIVKCVTLQADAVVISPSYTPGAGNFW